MAKVKALKPRTVYTCQACGHVEPKWLGRCPTCQEWNSLVEEVGAAEPPRPSSTGVADGAAPMSIAEVGESFGGPRRHSGIGELDRVLGGGLVAGSMVLLGGDPGVGKSTLLIQALAGLAADGAVLYATGEESVAQTAMRARRVGAARQPISIVAETDVEKILAHARAVSPAILAVDSIQTVYTPISCVEPNRFLWARRMRYGPPSPSSWSTTSTRCSSVLGPASAPSLVTWPTTIVGVPVVFANWVSRDAHSRTCASEPGIESRIGV